MARQNVAGPVLVIVKSPGVDHRIRHISTVTIRSVLSRSLLSYVTGTLINDKGINHGSVLSCLTEHAQEPRKSVHAVQ